MLIYAFVLLRYSYGSYDRSSYATYDLAIFDQATWLISRFKSPYITIRGCHILGDHFSPILYLCAPFYWIWSSPKTLLTLQTLSLATGAAPIYFFAKSKTTSALTGLIAGLAYLSCPAIIGENLKDFHPECLATSWLIWAFYFSYKRQWIPCLLFVVLSSLCKESAGFALVLFGVYLCPKSPRMGCVVAVCGIASIFISMAVIRFFNEGRPSAYWVLFSDFGSNPSNIAGYVLAHPLQIFQHANNSLTRIYLFKLLAPLLFLPLLAPEVLLIGLPVFLMYVLSRNYNSVDLAIDSQYAAFATPFLCCAAVVGYDRWRRFGNRWTSALLGAVLLCQIVILANNNASSIFEIVSGRLTQSDEVNLEAKKVYDRLIPENASVCINDQQVTWFSHRESIHSFPNPFFPIALGNTVDALEQQRGNNFPPFDLRKIRERIDSSAVEYIVIGNCHAFWPLGRDQSKRVAEEILMSPSYSVRYADQRMILFQRSQLQNSQKEWRAGIDLFASVIDQPAKNREEIVSGFSHWFDEAIR